MSFFSPSLSAMQSPYELPRWHMGLSEQETRELCVTPASEYILDTVEPYLNVAMLSRWKHFQTLWDERFARDVRDQKFDAVCYRLRKFAAPDIVLSFVKTCMYVQSKDPPSKNLGAAVLSKLKLERPPNAYHIERIVLDTDTTLMNTPIFLSPTPDVIRNIHKLFPRIPNPELMMLYKLIKTTLDSDLYAWLVSGVQHDATLKEKLACYVATRCSLANEKKLMNFVRVELRDLDEMITRRMVGSNSVWTISLSQPGSYEGLNCLEIIMEETAAMEHETREGQAPDATQA